MARRIPAIPSEWEEYLSCILLHMLLPLLPVGLEAWQTGHIKEDSLSLAASMYAIAIGVSSRSRLCEGF
jgi:hypothetical protein